MQNDNDKLELLRKELRITRIFCILSSVLTVCLLVGIILLLGMMKPVYKFMEEAEPVLVQASKLDVETFNDTLGQMQEAFGKVDWEQLSDSLNSLDVDAINNALEGLDMEEFSRSMTNLNDVIETLRDLGAKFNALSSVFGMEYRPGVFYH